MLSLNDRKIFFLIGFVTILFRLIYHTNTPLMVDEGLFLLDSSKSICSIYLDTLYMKPYIGAFYYNLIYDIAKNNSFLYLHITTTLFILISNIFIYLIVKQKTQNILVSFVSSMLFLTFANITLSGYACSSLEHLQAPFLLFAYYFVFIKSKRQMGLMFLSFAIMIKQNVLLILIGLCKTLVKYWLFSILLLVFWVTVSVLFFDNIIFNLFLFPSKYYDSDFNIKIFGFYNYFLKIGFGFNIFLLLLFLLGARTFYTNYKDEFIFIILLIISIIPTPMYPQHFVVLIPFLIIVGSVTIENFFYKNKKSIIILGCGLLFIFNILLQFKNYQYTKKDYILTDQTIVGELDGDKKSIEKMYKFLSHNKKEKVYLYPLLVPELYIINDLKTIDRLFSNDHFEIIIKNKFLRDELLESIKLSEPLYLIKMKDSEIDKYLDEIIKSDYYHYQKFGNINVFKRK